MSRPSQPLLFASAIALLACAQAPVAARGGAATAPPALRELTLPGRGVLLLPLPGAWTVTPEEGRPGEEAPPFTLRIEPPDGRFRAFLTPLPASTDPLVGDLDRAKGLAEAARRAAEPGSAEGRLVLRELKRDGALRGYWFYATDPELTRRAAGREEWRGIVTGYAAAGDLLVAFNLFDELSGSHRAALLDAIASARHLPPDRGEPALALVPFLPAAELTLPLPGGQGDAAVHAPGFLVTRPMATAEVGEIAAYARDPASGVHVAITARAAHGAATPGACRAEPALRLRGTDGIRELAGTDRADAARVSYFSTPAASDRTGQARWHVREWYARDGLCVEVHVSAVAGAPSTGIVESILQSFRFGG